MHSRDGESVTLLTMNGLRPPFGALAEFHRLYDTKPRVFRAPGRINLIGEHTDYNDGFVMPAAIDFATWVAGRSRPDRKLKVRSMAFNESAELDLDHDCSSQPQWARLVREVALMLEHRGARLRGADLVIDGDVPIGAGLSSSASLEVAVGLALLAMSSEKVDKVQLAQAAQAAEISATGARCGIMDQFVSAHGHANDLLLLDCRTLDYQLIPMSSDMEIVICNTMIKHSIAAGEYNSRRADCEEGVRLLKRALPTIEALRDVNIEQLAEHKALLPEVIYRRCRHVITENDRVQAMARALQTDDKPMIGRLMKASHDSLRDDYEVTCHELDVMVNAANAAPGLIGARMTGGGFGGCTVNLVAANRTKEFIESVGAGYERSTGIKPTIFSSRASNGASEWQENA
jgi:galactokinase